MAGAEQVFRAPGAIIGGGRVLPSPAAFYLTGEDNLRIVSANSVTGVSLKLNWRHAEPNGVTKPDSETHTPNTNRSVKTQDFSLGAGSLLNVTVFANAGTPRIGQTYVMVQLVRGAGAAAIVLGTLLAGYVTTTQALGWPGSPIVSSTAGEPCLRFISGTVPAAGAEIRETVPTGARWDLLSFHAALATAGVGGVRTPNFLVLDGATVSAVYPPSTGQDTGVTWHHTWGAALSSQASGAALVSGDPLPAPVLLTAGEVFGTTTTFLQATDQWTVPTYYVREWLEVG